MAYVKIKGKGLKQIDGLNLNFQKGSGSYLVIAILRMSDRPMSISEIADEILMTKAGELLLKKQCVGNIEVRVKRVVEWLSSKKLINKVNGKIELI